MNNLTKLFSKILFQKEATFPYVSLSLALSCVVVSVPAYFRSDLYKVLALLPDNPRWWQFVTFQFSHAEPESGVSHLIGCLIGIVLTGLLIERILGSGRFFILSSATFATCLIYNLAKSRNISIANGASGMIVGYLVFTPFILAWGWQRYHSKLQYLRQNPELQFHPPHLVVEPHP